MKTRNLLLALGCAAALTACTTNDEPNVAPAPAKKVVTLNVDVNEPADTRVEYNKVGTTYKFAWSDYDVLRVFYNDGSDEVYADFTIDKNSIDGKKASFTSEYFPNDFKGPVTIVYASGDLSFTDFGSGMKNGLEFSYEGNTSTTDVSADLAKRTLLYAKTMVEEAGTLPDVTLKNMFSYLLLKEGLKVVDVEDSGVLTGEVAFTFGSQGEISFNSDGLSSLGGFSVFNKVNIENNALKYDCLVPIFTSDDNLTDQLYVSAEYNGKSGSTSQPTFTYEPGKIYVVEAGNEKWEPVNVAIPEVIVDLSELTEDFVAQDGDILTGKATDKYKISVAAGATVTLKDVDITSFDSEGPKYAGINCIGDATLVIEGTNHVKGAYNECSGIHIPENFTLTIEGTGKLTAESNGYGAGIGAGYYWGAAGNIIINSGEIIANGGKDCAGIGGGCERKCGDITINGGTVTATSSLEGAGIGSGYHTSCGNITINGGTIIATGGSTAAGIGAGYESGSCGVITITSGEVTATGGKQGAGIGSGYYSSSCGNINILGGTIKAFGGTDGAGIGTGSTWYHGYNSSCGDITISGGSIEATKGGAATYDVGPGNGERYGFGTCGTVTIDSEITILDKNGNPATIYASE